MDFDFPMIPMSFLMASNVPTLAGTMPPAEPPAVEEEPLPPAPTASERVWAVGAGYPELELHTCRGGRGDAGVQSGHVKGGTNCFLIMSCSSFLCREFGLMIPTKEKYEAKIVKTGG